MPLNIEIEVQDCETLTLEIFDASNYPSVSIDDNAGLGDTDVAWSADKSSRELSQKVDKDDLANPDKGAAMVAYHGGSVSDKLDEFDAEQSSREQEFRTFIASSGYQFAGDYAADIEITQYNQLVRDENGEFWRVSGQVDLPYVTTGAGIPEDDALVPAGDAVLRQDLIGSVVAGLGARKVQGSVMYVSAIADLYAIETTGLIDGQIANIRGSEFVWVSSENRWAPTTLHLRTFGLVGDYNSDTGIGTDDTQAIIDAISFASTSDRGVEVVFPSGANILVSGTIDVDTRNRIRQLDGKGCRIFTSADAPIFNITGSAVATGGPSTANAIRAERQGYFNIKGFNLLSTNKEESFGSGIVLSGVLWGSVRNNSFTSIGTGIRFDTVNRNVSIESNMFYNIRDYGIHLSPGHNVHQLDILNNKAFGFRKWFFNDNAEVVNMVMNSNWAECGRGDQLTTEGIVDIASSSSILECIISGNSFQDHVTMVGPVISITRPGGGIATYASVTNNIISNTPEGIPAVYLGSLYGVDVSGNNFFNIGGYCIEQEMAVGTGQNHNSSYRNNLATDCAAMIRVSAAFVTSNINVTGNSISRKSPADVTTFDFQLRQFHSFIFSKNSCTIGAISAGQPDSSEMYFSDIHASLPTQYNYINARGNSFYASGSNESNGMRVSSGGSSFWGIIADNTVFAGNGTVAFELPQHDPGRTVVRDNISRTR